MPEQQDYVFVPVQGKKPACIYLLGDEAGCITYCEFRLDGDRCHIFDGVSSYGFELRDSQFRTDHRLKGYPVSVLDMDDKQVEAVAEALARSYGCREDCLLRSLYAIRGAALEHKGEIDESREFERKRVAD